MDAVVGLLGTVVVLAAVLAGFWWLARRIRRSGAGARLMGPLDDMWNPAALHLLRETEVAPQRLTPMPSADDRWPPFHPPVDRQP